MPSSAPSDHRAKRTSDGGAADLRNTLRRLREFYEQGRESLAQYPDRMAYGGMKTVAEEGQSPELLRKARAFADPESGYAPRELEQLIARCEREAFPLGVSHIISLLRVPKGDGRRRDFEQRAIAGRWSRRQLETEIRKEFPSTKSHAGRRAQLPQDKDEALIQIARLCRKWEGLIRVLLPEGDEEGVDLPPRVCRRLRDADHMMKLLTKVVQD